MTCMRQKAECKFQPNPWKKENVIGGQLAGEEELKSTQNWRCFKVCEYFTIASCLESVKKGVMIWM